MSAVRTVLAARIDRSYELNLRRLRTMAEFLAPFATVDRRAPWVRPAHTLSVRTVLAP
jgi:hypothetical protein